MPISETLAPPLPTGVSPPTPPPGVIFVPATAEFKNQDYRGSHGVIREEASPAERASGVGQKPSVNTLHVEGMAAFWEQSEIIFPLKLTQTHSTIKMVLVFQTNYGFVVENWESINERLVHPSIMEVEKLLLNPAAAAEGGKLADEMVKETIFHPFCRYPDLDFEKSKKKNWEFFLGWDHQERRRICVEIKQAMGEKEKKRGFKTWKLS
nr:hypothetical protein GW17_00007284 [Ipomoea batatas]